MARLIIAPVGLQPAAVYTPLLSRFLQPSIGDMLMLVVSEETRESATRMKAEVASLSSEVLVLQGAAVGPLPGVVLEALAGHACQWLDSNDDEVLLLANGGDGLWAQQILDMLVTVGKDREERVAVAFSTERGTILRLDGKVKDFAIEDVDLERLLSLLDLFWDKRCSLLRRRHGQQQIDGVADLVLAGGSLAVCIRTECWPNANKQRLSRYRDLQRYGFLQELGLERRRIFLELSNHWHDNRLAVLANDDRIACSRRNRWAEFVESLRGPPNARATSRENLRQPPSGLAADDESKMSQPPLVVILGTNPGPTVQAILSHGPAQVLMLFDQTDPGVLKAAHKIAELHKTLLRSWTIEPVPAGAFDERVARMRKLFETDGRLSTALHVSLTPGDKLRRLALQLFAKRSGQDHRFWLLDRSMAIEMSGREDSRSAVAPLDAWLHVHATHAVTMDAAWNDGDVPSLVAQMASDVIEYLRSSGPVPEFLWSENDGRLRLLGVPNGQFYRAVQRVWPGKLAVPLPDRGPAMPATRYKHYSLQALFESANSPALPQAFLPLEAAEDGRANPNGRWFEWVVGANLARANLEEVWIGVRHGERADGRFSDELDVVTRHGDSYVHWSCKTASGKDRVNAAAREAQSRATRFLGRGAWAVVVVPHMRRPSEAWQKVGDWRWRVDEKVDVVDARFFECQIDVVALASAGSGRSR